jgi:hypothetical protein
MNWRKLGQIYKHDINNSFLLTHAANPLAINIDGGDTYRVLFSARNADNKSSIAYVDFNIKTLKIIDKSSKPIFVFGEPNSFYSHGVSIGNLYRQNDKDYILFMGWNIKENQHWRGDIGRLELKNNIDLSLSPNQSFLTIDSEDKVSLSYPCVIFHQGIYKMWYGSTITWETENGEMLHVIKYATSIDGENWQKLGIAIPYQLGQAQAFSRPTVIIDKFGYHMWYSYRSGNSTKYRIGYSHSDDGLMWQRKHDEVGIDVSKDGWDNEMICYPFVFEHNKKRYMLYNGNEFGKDGFGIAVLENND